MPSALSPVEKILRGAAKAAGDHPKAYLWDAALTDVLANYIFNIIVDEGLSSERVVERRLLDGRRFDPARDESRRMVMSISSEEFKKLQAELHEKHRWLFV